jgi:hypothetical protein
MSGKISINPGIIEGYFSSSPRNTDRRIDPEWVEWACIAANRLSNALPKTIQNIMEVISISWEDSRKSKDTCYMKIVLAPQGLSAKWNVVLEIDNKGNLNPIQEPTFVFGVTLHRDNGNKDRFFSIVSLQEATILAITSFISEKTKGIHRMLDNLLIPLVHPRENVTDIAR